MYNKFSHSNPWNQQNCENIEFDWDLQQSKFSTKDCRMKNYIIGLYLCAHINDKWYIDNIFKLVSKFILTSRKKSTINPVSFWVNSTNNCIDILISKYLVAMTGHMLLYWYKA